MKNEVYEEFSLADFVRLFPDQVDKVRQIFPVELLLRSRFRYVVRVYSGKISIVQV